MASAPVKGVVKLLVGSGVARPSPAIGQALGPLGELHSVLPVASSFTREDFFVVCDLLTCWRWCWSSGAHAGVLQAV